ncbi:MAG: hypothetical protein LCI00_09450 [Chloroflexi bacterium]|nr:hypothetical protein [Chloroflexota bacterium]MCC6893050.1 hypothetical protein [Anaerolineae bacterium]
MLPNDHAQTFANAPIEDLLSILLRQLKRPLGTQGFKLTDAEANRLASERAAGKTPERSIELVTALEGIVDESNAVLGEMGLTFESSLKADLSTLGGWETTAEFLDLANEKANAELRITLAAALDMAFVGDERYAPYLLFLAGDDFGDETVIARRILSFVTGIKPDAPDWLTKVRSWLDDSA